MEPEDDRWNSLSSAIAPERDGASFMSLLLDDELVRRASVSLGDGRRGLDYGSGTGTLALRLSAGGAQMDAFEPTPSQFDMLTEAAAACGSSLRCLRSDDLIRGPYDLVLCVNVLDHIEAWQATVSRFGSWLRPSGRLLLVVPHPLKDLGDWRREPEDGDASSYVSYELQGYLEEGPCHKNRENRFGQVVARDVPSHHRTVSTYYNGIVQAGFRVEELVEPTPDPARAEDQPVLFTKCSRIPYFLLFDCERTSTAAPQTAGGSQ